MNNQGINKLIMIKCENCGKGIHIYEEYVREKMFCTLGCMDMFRLKKS